MSCTDCQILPIPLDIIIEDINDVLPNFNKLQIHRSVSGIGGPYLEITCENTRIWLKAGQTCYSYTDKKGSDEFYYKYREYNSETSTAGTFSDPIRGTPHPALDVVSIEDLKTNYLFGLDLTDDSGEPYPDSLFAYYIINAVDWLEKKLDIPIIPKRIVEERHDFYRQDYRNYIWMKTQYYPIIGVEEVKLVFPGEEPVIIYDKSWIQMQRDNGQIQIMPGPASSPNAFFGARAGGNIFRRLWQNDFMPNVFRVTYECGFGRPTQPDSVTYPHPEWDNYPPIISELAAKIASYGPLNIGGDLLGGAGVASASIGLDGLSTSFATTCLHPETAILLEGYKKATIKELADSGEPFVVRTVNKHGDPVIAKATRAFPTLKAYMWEVRLAKGSVWCTGDHLFMLRDGSWCSASALSSGQELMSIEGRGVEERVLLVSKTRDEKQLYDLEVPGFECFGVGAGVVVHNSSATNAGYGARITQYNREVKDQIPSLRAYYKGIPMVVG